MPSGAAVERDLHEIGRELAARFPPRTRHPVRALDAKAMELSSQDAELRAALFRFVDVTPACRSLDDLARHLSGYLEGVHETPPPLRAAMRMAESRAGRAALGAAAAGGVSTWRTASSPPTPPTPPSVSCARCGATGSRRRSTCSARPPS